MSKPGSLSEALSREWLCTNGLGGYSSSTLPGCNTRRYHGLLVAALNPPVERTLLLAKLDETLWVGSLPFELGTNEFEDGVVHPSGYQYLADFSLPLGIPTFLYAFQGWRLEKKIWMEQGENSVFVRYTLLDAPSACRLQMLLLCAYRDVHGEQQGSDGWRFGAVEEDGRGLRIDAFPGARPFWLASDQPAGFEQDAAWHWRFAHTAERERGLNWVEDFYRPGILAVALLPGQPVQVRCTIEERPADFVDALDRRLTWATQVTRQAAPLRVAVTATAGGGQRTESAASPNHDAVIASLNLAADQFLVRRGPGMGQTVIAGYHWFGDWGRDTMISLPGLTLCRGQFDAARQILRTFAGLVDGGLIPNAFDEGGGACYNTVDATLWFFHALDRYLQAREDPAFLREMFPIMAGIVECHLQGTRYGIHVDPEDGLLHAGENGVQLTWMDAKVEDWVVTPRAGKPVEVNALWFNALCLMAAWGRELGHDSAEHQKLATLVGASFRKRFWNERDRCLYDVVDGPDGDDATFRPNQIFALSLPFAPLFGDRAKAVVDAVAAKLLTPYGLRSLAPDDARYIGEYAGDRWRRDGCYHQGTVWAWLIGPFVDAHLRVYRRKDQAAAFLEPLARHMQREAGLGSISEIFDGDAPHTPRGCIAQAWSVAEMLRCWSALHASPAPGQGQSLQSSSTYGIGENHGSH